MITPNRPRDFAPMFAMLSEGQIKQLHYAALDVLERTGVVFQHEQAVEILRSAGCKVHEGGLVKIPAWLVEEALRLTPPSVSVYDRLGGLRMKLEKNNVYFGAGGSCPYLVRADGSHTPFTSAHCAANARIVDALENIDFCMAMAHCGDFPAQSRDVREIFTVLSNTVKPIIITSHSRRSLETIVQMCGTISGGRERFLDKPYLIYYTEPVSPLQHTAHSVDKLLAAAELGLPILNTPAPMAGGTAPITLAGTLLSGVAELLSGIVLLQNYRKGTGVIFGGVFTTLDMKDMIFSYGGPELQLMNTAIAQLSQFYGIPSFGTAGASDAHELDGQAAFECGVSILLNALSGSNLVHDVGWLSAAQGTSDELLVLCDEMIGYAKRYLSGINTDLIERSVEELSAVGPGGNFIQRDMTLELFRKEVWYPSLMSRMPHKAWMSSGKRSLNDRLAGRAADIAANHKVTPIPEDRLRDINKAIAAYEKELAR